MEKKKNLKLCTILILSTLLVSCSGRRVNSEDSVPVQDEKDKKIDALSSSLSRSQLRIEELDAKISTLSDKMESVKITLDNVAGLKPVQTEMIGTKKSSHDKAAKADAAETPEEATAKANYNSVPLKMEPAIHEFGSALSLYKAGKYTDSELAFNQFSEKNPEHVLAGSAQFYAGESYFMMKEYKLALNEYTKVVSSFPNSPRAASAMVRMSHCYELLGNKAEAEKTKTLARDLYYGNPTLELNNAENNTTEPTSHVLRNPSKETTEAKAATEPTAKEPAVKDSGSDNTKSDQELDSDDSDSKEPKDEALKALPMEPSDNSPREISSALVQTKDYE